MEPSSALLSGDLVARAQVRITVGILVITHYLVLRYGVVFSVIESYAVETSFRPFKIMKCRRVGSGLVPLPPVFNLFAIVVQRTGRRWSLDARNCAQVLVDRPQVMRAHIPVHGPRHHLQQIAVERRRKVWVHMVHVYAGSNNRQKFLEGMTAFSHSGFVRRQVAGVKVRNAGERPKIPATPKVSRWVDLRDLGAGYGFPVFRYSVGGPALWQPLQSATAFTR